jgi:NAD(P)-dependent dehydrogenase (short-subunit alcohol dehydrogenase family)
MVLNAFDLTGKVAIVTGCDTGLGQGMTLALAQAGCDIVGVNRKIPHETAEQVLALGRRFTAIQATSAIRMISPTSSRKPSPPWAGSIFWSITPVPYAAPMR